MVYWVVVITVFLYDRYVSSFRPVFVDLRQSDRDLAGDGLSFGCSRLATRIVILRYQEDGVSGGC